MIKDGYYDCRATAEVEYGFSTNNHPQVSPYIDVLEDLPPGAPDNAPRRVLTTVFVRVTLSPDGAKYAIAKLRALGWTGTDIGNVQFPAPALARCKCESRTYQDKAGKDVQTQDWDIVTGSAKPFKDDKVMSATDRERLSAQFAAMCGGKAPPAAARQQRAAPSYGPQGTAGGPPPGMFPNDDPDFA